MAQGIRVDLQTVFTEKDIARLAALLVDSSLILAEPSRFGAQALAWHIRELRAYAAYSEAVARRLAELNALHAEKTGNSCDAQPLVQQRPVAMRLG